MKDSKRLKNLLLAGFSVACVFVCIAPLWFFFQSAYQRDVPYIFQSDVSSTLGTDTQGSLVEQGAWELPPGYTFLRAVALSYSGDRALIELAAEKGGVRLFLWGKGGGITPISPLSTNIGNVPSMNLDATRVVYFQNKAKSGVKYLSLWEEAFGSEDILEASFSGDWDLEMSGNGESVLASPMQTESWVEITRGNARERVTSALMIHFLSEDVLPPLRDRPSSRKLSYRLEPLPQLRASEAVRLSNGVLRVLRRSDASGSGPLELLAGRPKGRHGLYDLNGDGGADLLTYQKDTEHPFWRGYLLNGADGLRPGIAGTLGSQKVWRVGAPRAVPVPGDYDGNGSLDLATYLPSYADPYGPRNGNWQIYLSKKEETSREMSEKEGNNFLMVRYFSVFWGHGDAVAVPADYDGDGSTDIAVYSPLQGMWHLLYSGGGFNRAKALLGDTQSGRQIQWGLPSDTLAPGDYNGDGCADLALVRNAGVSRKLQWLVQYHPCAGNKQGREDRFFFGVEGDIPLPADYNGDGVTDAAVFSAKDSNWLLRLESEVKIELRWAVSGGHPFVADFDGDTAADPAFFVPKGKYRFQIASSRSLAAYGEMFRKEAPMVFQFRWGNPKALPVQLWQRSHWAGEGN